MRSQESTFLSRRSLLRAAGITAGAVATAPLLTGCGSGAATGSTTSSVTYWHYMVASDKAQTQMNDTVVELFTKTRPEITVDKVYVPHDQIAAKVIGSGTTKQGPDVLQQTGDLDQFVPAGLVQDLTDRWKAWDQSSQFPDTALGRINGKIYAIKPYANLIGLWYNQDILDEFRITPPTTMDELGEALKKIGKKYVGLGIAGSGEGLDGDWQGRPFYSAYGFDYLKPEVSALEEAFTLLDGWRQAGYLPADVATWTQVSSFPRFTAGQVAFCVNGNWQYGNAKKDAKFRYGVVPIPQGPKGGTVYLGGESFCIGSFTKNADLAWDFIKTTWASRDGGLAALHGVGSIPLRKDAATDPAFQDPVIKQFQEATKHGTDYPDPGLGTNVGAVRQAMARGWNAMMSGQQTPAAAAKSVVDTLATLIKK